MPIPAGPPVSGRLSPCRVSRRRSASLSPKPLDILNEGWDTRKDMAAILQLHTNTHNKTVVTNQALSDGKTVTLVCKSRVVDGKVGGNVSCKPNIDTAAA